MVDEIDIILILEKFQLNLRYRKKNLIALKSYGHLFILLFFSVHNQNDFYFILQFSIITKILDSPIRLMIKDQINQKLNQIKYKSQSYILKVVLNIAISSVLIGFSNVYFSVIDYEDFVRIFEITQYKAFYQGLITGSVPLTASFGGLIASFLLNRLSRMHCFLLINAIYVFILAGLMIKNIYVLIFFRLIQGCATGAFSSMVPLYIKQITPLQLNGKMGTFFQMFMVGGLILAFLLGFLFDLFLSPQVYWRIIFIFPIFLLAFQSYNLIYKYHYETPKYLLSINKTQEAISLLKVFYKQQCVEQRLQELKKMLYLATKKHVELQSISKYEKIGQNQNNVIQKKNKEVKQVQYHNNKLAIVAAMHIGALQPLSGISIVIGYGGQISKIVFPSLAKVLPIFLHFLGIVACFFTIQLLKKYGRKTLIQCGTVGCGIFTLMLGYNITSMNNQNKQIQFGAGLLIVISMYAYRFIYGVTIGAVSFLYVPEIVQPNIMPVFIIFYWLMFSLLMIVFPILRIHVFDGNPGPIFMFFGIYTLISIITNHYVLVQTKDKKEYEVRMEYDRKLGIVRNELEYEQKA